MQSVTFNFENKEQLKAFEALAKAFKISYSETKEKPYNPEFVEKIRRSQEEVKAGRVKKVGIDSLWK